ncbi:PhoH family protein [Synechococcus sp. C9]|uniref:PhoH family protein n=1 Tax=Synechococcus sp. C9 TaxID=102119 RepID=UPI001FF6C979|nr:PhoH family protein [Synechococcus sp. C9]
MVLPLPNRASALALAGVGEVNLRQLTQATGVQAVLRGQELHLVGQESQVNQCMQVVDALAHLWRRGQPVTAADIDTVLSAPDPELVTQMHRDVLAHTRRGEEICARTFGQWQYIQAIRTHEITFGIGPAGTGKTYLAAVLAVQALQNQECERLILTRPAVEAGEKLGFLPGDLQQKISPYLRPLYDALYDLLDPVRIPQLLERGVVEVAPLAYMRGRTLNRAFIILDEAQNTTPGQMKMLLTRLGFGSRMVITGDTTQVDLDRRQDSGLTVAAQVLKGVPGIGFCHLTAADVVRHPLVQRIVTAYEQYEQSG